MSSDIQAIVFEFALFALFVVMMIFTSDMRLGQRACEQCGQRGEHLAGCPGRRGY